MTGERLERFLADHGEWSQATFGSDSERGPVGPLRHLHKETLEAVDAWEVGLDLTTNIGGLDSDLDDFKYEMADCFLLLSDALRRSGMTFDELLDFSEKKLAKNKKRVWKKSDDPNSPIEHDRSGE